MARSEFAFGDGMDLFAEERGPDGQGQDLGLEPSNGIHYADSLEQRATFELACMNGQVEDLSDDLFDTMVEVARSMAPVAVENKDASEANEIRRGRQYSQRRFRGKPIIVRETPEVAALL